MKRNPNEIELVVSRTLRESLEKLQRTTDELNHAVSDLVSACSSARPANSLPPMLRAQTSAASLCATLEVLSRFVSTALQPGLSPFASESHAVDAVEPADEPVAEPIAREVVEAPAEMVPVPAAAKVAPPASQSVAAPVADPASEWVSDPAPAASTQAPVSQSASEISEFEPMPSEETPTELTASNNMEMEEVEPTDVDLSAFLPQADSVGAHELEDEPEEAHEDFDLSLLRQEEQDLHRRADRVAKVAMQDIKLLHPEEVKLGRAKKDLCQRLHGDIEKAHREYDRRFHSILDHPVDYFYKRMVEILCDGDVEALGEYPYPSPVLRR